MKQYAELKDETNLKTDSISFLIGLLVVGVIIILTVVPLYKNAYYDEIDPDLLQINLDETIDKVGLTKT